MIMRPFVIGSGSQRVCGWPVASGIGGCFAIDHAFQFVRASLEEVSGSITAGCYSRLALVAPVFGSFSASGDKAPESSKKTNKTLLDNRLAAPCLDGFRRLGILWCFHDFSCRRPAVPELGVLQKNDFTPTRILQDWHTRVDKHQDRPFDFVVSPRLAFHFLAPFFRRLPIRLVVVASEVSCD